MWIASRSYFAHYLFCQFRGTNGATEDIYASALAGHVGQVGGLGSKEEVGRVNTPWNITTMADVHPGWDRADKHTVCYPMGIGRTPINGDPSVSELVASASP